MALAVALILGLGAVLSWSAAKRHWARERAERLAAVAHERIALEDPVAALELLRESVALDSVSSAQGALRQMVTMALGPQDDPDTAAEACELLLTMSPQDADALFALGLALARQGKALEAAQSFARAAEERGQWPEALANEGLCLLAAGRPEEAALRLRDAAPAVPERYPDLLTALGQALLRCMPPDVDGAEQAFAMALERQPANGQATAGVGIVRFIRGDLDGALAELAEAELLAPLDPDVLAARGALLARAGREAEAEAALHRAVAIEPAHAAGRYNLGCLYLRRKESLLAEVQFRMASQATPQDPLARLGWAMALRLEGRSEDAAVQLARSLDLSPPGGAAALARAELLALSSEEELPMLPLGL